MVIILLHTCLVAAFGILCFASVQFAQAMLVNHNVYGLRGAHKILEIEEQYIYNRNSYRNQLPKPVNMKSLGGSFPDGTVLTNLNGVILSSNAMAISVHIDDTFLGDIRQSPRFLWGILRRKSAPFEDTISCVFRDGSNVIYFRDQRISYLSWPALLLAGTVTIPSVIVMTALGFMVFGKILISGMRVTLMYFLDVATEKNPAEYAPVMLIGITAGILLLIVNCLAALISSL